MGRVVVCAALAAISVASATAAGQNFAGAAAASTLNLRIVPVDVTQADPLHLAFKSDTMHNAVLAGQVGAERVRRFSVQYQLREGAGFEGLLDGLAVCDFSITGTVSGGTVSSLVFDRAALTRAQGSNVEGGAGLDSMDPVGPTDSSGNTTGIYTGVTGLHRMWRDSLAIKTAAGNNLPHNGTPGAGGIFQAEAVRFAPADQRPADYPGAWFGLYEFTVAVGDAAAGGDVTVGVNIQVLTSDPATGAIWAVHGGGILLGAQNYSVTGASFQVQSVPAVSSLAVLGLGGFAATRRRRRG